MNIKYTTDGKKVVVLGDLNSNEKIVQEIFITPSGNELPGGENFVVKSLLDEPAKSWKEEEIAKLEKRYNDRKREIQRDMDDLEEKYN